MRVLATNYGANAADGTDSSEVRSRTGQSGYVASGSDIEIELPTLRPKRRGEDGGYGAGDLDDGSLTSNDSQRMIIRQEENE